MAEEKRFQMTAKALDRLQEELTQLEGEGRQRVIDAISTARSHGDLSENAEYHAAREQQGMQEARIRQLRQMIENAEIVEASDDDTVGPGKLVTLRYEGDDGTETYLIGLREEKGGEHDVVTPESPLGLVLMGKTTGETVVTTAPAGDVKVEIIEVKSAAGL